MKRMFLSILAVLAAAPLTSAHAANLAVIATPSGLFTLLVIVGAVACTTGAFKVWTLIRGGRLSRSWQWFIGGFVCLSLAEIILLFRMFEVLTLPEFVAPLLLLAMAGLFFYGLIEIRRTLS